MTMTTMNLEQKIEIPQRLYFRIGDVAELLDLKPYVLRYWESEFPMLSPEKSNSGQRVYRRSDVETLAVIKRLLYSERYSIEGARNKIRELRKEGDLAEFKKDSVAAPQGLSAERKKEIQAAIHELKSAASTPVSQMFTL